MASNIDGWRVGSSEAISLSACFSLLKPPAILALFIFTPSP